jgi:hypothetical protein
MKNSLLIGLVVGLIAVPTLSMAGGLAGQNGSPAAVQLSDNELAEISGQGLGAHAEAKNQEGRIVIWDDWAHSNSGGTGTSTASIGQVSINYAAGQAMLTATR